MCDHRNLFQEYPNKSTQHSANILLKKQPVVTATHYMLYFMTSTTSGKDSAQLDKDMVTISRIPMAGSKLPLDEDSQEKLRNVSRVLTPRGPKHFVGAQGYPSMVVEALDLESSKMSFSHHNVLEKNGQHITKPIGSCQARRLMGVAG